MIDSSSKAVPHLHARHEAVTMSLYIAIVVLALLVGFGDEGDSAHEVALIWGTVIGLAVAHLYAYRTTAILAAGGKPEAEDYWAALGIVVAAVVIAALATIPYLIWGDTTDASTASSMVLMAVIGIASYIGARHAGAGTVRSVVYTVVGLITAAIAVIVKYTLAH